MKKTTHSMRRAIRTFVVFLLTCLLPLPLFAALDNPLNQNFSSIPAFIAGALKALALIALPIITLFLVISGFLFVSARGNAQQLETAKRNFFYVIIGAILILGAWIIATLIAGTVNQIAGGAGTTQGVNR